MRSTTGEDQQYELRVTPAWFTAVIALVAVGLVVIGVVLVVRAFPDQEPRGCRFTPYRGLSNVGDSTVVTIHLVGAAWPEPVLRGTGWSGNFAAPTWASMNQSLTGTATVTATGLHVDFGGGHLADFPTEYCS